MILGTDQHNAIGTFLTATKGEAIVFVQEKKMGWECIPKLYLGLRDCYNFLRLSSLSHDLF